MCFNNHNVNNMQGLLKQNVLLLTYELASSILFY